MINRDAFSSSRPQNRGISVKNIILFQDSSLNKIVKATRIYFSIESFNYLIKFLKEKKKKYRSEIYSPKPNARIKEVERSRLTNYLNYFHVSYFTVGIRTTITSIR